MAAAFPGREILSFRNRLHEKLRERKTFFYFRFKGFRPLRLNKAVGIVFGRQHDKTHLLRVPHHRKRRYKRPTQCLLPRAVTVETEINLVRRFQELMHVIRRNRRSQRRHRFLKASLSELNNVHIAFADDGTRLFPDGVICFKEAVDFQPLVINHRFRAIDVFRYLVRYHCPSPETDDLTATIADRKNHAAAVPIVSVTFVIDDDEAATVLFFHFRVVVLTAEYIAQTVKVVRRVPQTVTARRRSADAATFEVILSALTCFE